MNALQTFSLLTIGDGIVTQVPALIISTATGIIVTRSSADRQLSTEVISQLASVPKIPLIVMGALFVLMLLPGMPKWPIAILAVLAVTLWLSSRRKAQPTEAAVLADGDAASLQPGAVSTRPAIQVLLGKDLSGHWSQLKPLLGERIDTLRTQQERASGFAFPPVVFQDGLHLGPNEYEIQLFGARHARSQLYPDKTLAIRTAAVKEPLPGVETRDPAFGIVATWVDADLRDRAEQRGYTLVDPITVLMTHLGEVLRSEVAQLLSRTHVVALLDEIRGRHPGMVEELIPTIMTMTDVQRVLQNLLMENVSIRNIDLIVDALLDAGRHTKDHSDITEAVRQKLSHGICDDLRASGDQLSVLSLNPRLEAQITENIRRSDGKTGLVIDPKLAEYLIRALVPLVDRMMQQGRSPVLLCGPEIRRHIKTFTRRTVPRLAVVSVNEVPSSMDLASFEVINFE